MICYAILLQELDSSETSTGYSGNWSTEVQLRYVVNGVLIIPIFTHIVNLLKRCVSEKNGPCNMSLVDSASSCI